MSQTVTAPKAATGSLVLTQSYTYDALNRLTSASENGAPSWQQTFDCDRWGNRAVRNTSYLPSPQLTPQSATATDFSAFNQSTNRLSQSKYTSLLYDGAGNLTRDMVSSTFTYDGENRQITSSVAGVSATYTYDGDGRRVKKVVGNTTTVFVYNVNGQLIAEYTSDPVPPPAGGGGTSYLTSDTLGSTRVVTKADGSVKARYDFLPFGEEISSSIGGRGGVVGYGGTDSTKQKFTSKERDTESGLDYFLARYYSSAQGRFTSPDVPLAGQEKENPQTWNLYTYTSNNPLSRYDPDGRRWFYKEEEGKLLDVQWVNPNDDGTYTSPGEEYKEFVPTLGRPYLKFYNQGHTVAYWFGEHPDGSPEAVIRSTGKIEDATVELVADYVLAKGIGKVVRAAYDEWTVWQDGKSVHEGARVDPNKLNHIFDKVEHNLGDLVRQFGSRESAFNAIQRATEVAVKSRGLQSVFETTVRVGTETITVRGIIIDGVVKIGTAFKP